MYKAGLKKKGRSKQKETNTKQAINENTVHPS